MDFKVVIFTLIFLVGIPVFVIIGTAWKPFRPILMAIMCFALVYPGETSMNLLSREWYRMTTRGVEIGLFDICSISLFLILILRPNREGDRFRWFPPLSIAYGIYVFFILVSWLFTEGNIKVPSMAIQMYASRGIQFYREFETSLYPMFEVLKQLRGGIVFLMIVNYVRDEKSMKTVVYCLAVAAILMSIEALKGRYIGGQHRVSATLGHANSLGTFSGMMGAFMFGIALYQPKFIASMIFAGCVAGSMVSVLLTISRGALAVFVMGIWIVTTSLIHRYINFKNVSMLALGGIVAIAIFASAADTLLSRFVGEQDAVSDIQYRGLYNEEARMMAADHPFGVGIGNFSTYSWIKYGPAVKLNEYGTQAHNLWFLTLGELGYPGLFAFIGYWLRFAGIAVPFLFRRRSSFVYAAAGAAAAAVLVGHIQFMLQLSYRQTSIFMMTKIFTGIVVAALYIHRDSIKEERRIRHAEHLEHWND